MRYRRLLVKQSSRKSNASMVFVLLSLSCLFIYLIQYNDRSIEKQLLMDDAYFHCGNIYEWVIKLNMTYLFDWTWYRNKECTRYLQLLKTNGFVAPKRYVSYVVNDVKKHLRINPDDGFIVDDFRQLPNPIPHSMPRSQNLNETCHALRLIGPHGWKSCTQNPITLSQRMPSTTHSVTVGILNAFVDNGSCHQDVPGTTYSRSSTYHFQQWCTKQCCNSPISTSYDDHQIEYHHELLNSVGVYLAQSGHFGPQQLPRIIRLLAVAPRTAKLLVAKGGVADQLVEILVERGLLSRNRVVSYDSGQVYGAKVVYRTESWPYLTEDLHSKYIHDRTDMETVHKAFISEELSDEKRNLILIVKRQPGTARAISNHNDMVQLVRESISKSKLKLKIAHFTASGHVRDHIKLWQQARIVIASHGAGLFNVLWCKPGTAIIEIGFTAGGSLPEMYFEMASHCGHRYWLVKGIGEKSKEITVDLSDLEWALHDALDLV